MFYLRSLVSLSVYGWCFTYEIFFLYFSLYVYGWRFTYEFLCVSLFVYGVRFLYETLCLFIVLLYGRCFSLCMVEVFYIPQFVCNSLCMVAILIPIRKFLYLSLSRVGALLLPILSSLSLFGVCFTYEILRDCLFLSLCVVASFFT